MLDRSQDFATLEDLEAALPHILAAPKDAAVVHSICRRATFGARDYPDHLEVTPQAGVVGDRWAEYGWLKLADGTPDPRNQVCILPTRVWQVACNRPGMPHPGDTIIADLDMTEENIPTWSHLQIGTAVLQVSDVFNDACVKWRARHGDESHRWLNLPQYRALRLRGMLCKVIQAGRFSREDRLRPIRKAAA